MNCNTTHYRANSSSVPGDPTETRFRLGVRANQPAPHVQSFVLRVREDGRTILEQKRDWQVNQAEQQIILAHRPAQSGVKQYDFEIDAAGDGKVAKPYRTQVQVLDTKHEILILEETWRWEYKFLHRLFEDDPSFRFTALLSRGSGAFVQYASPDRRINLVGFPQNQADLEGFDLFFVGDVNPTRWPRGVAAALAHQVKEEGKALVILAGPNLAQLVEVPELHALLPVDLPPEAGKPLDGPIEVRLATDSSRSPFFFQVRGAESLPPLDQAYPALRRRPGATVLLEAVEERNAYGKLIVMAEHTVGRGRVLFVGTDTLWKWQTLSAASEGPTPYSTFWQQAFRALTPAKSNIGPVNLWLTPNQSRGEAGRALTMVAEVQAARPLSSAKLEATALLPDGKRLPLVFSEEPAAPGRFHADFAAPSAGTYQISASLIVEGKTAAQATTPLEIEEPRQEDYDSGIDMLSLARLAQVTGGQIVDPARPESWPVASERDHSTVTRLRTLDLWNNFALLLVLCTLLGVDWVVRLLKGVV